LKPFLTLITSLSSSPESASYSLQYLQNLDTFTILETGPLEFFSQNSEQYVRAINSKDLVSSKDRTKIGPRIRLHKGDEGRVLSLSGEPLVVCWNIAYSALDLFLATIDFFLSTPSGEKSFLIIGSPLSMEVVIDLIGTILPLMNSLLKSEHPSLSSFISPSLFYNLFQIIQRVGSMGTPSIPILTSTLEVISTLAPRFPQEVWAYFKQSGIVFSTTTYNGFGGIHQGGSIQSKFHFFNLLATFECPTGRYSLTLTFLKLVSSLLELLKTQQQMQVQAQNQFQLEGSQRPISPTNFSISSADSMTLSTSSLNFREQAMKSTIELQAEVLSSCLSYIQNDIFLAYDSWRYEKIIERFQIGSSVLNIFDSIISSASIHLLSPTVSPIQSQSEKVALKTSGDTLEALQKAIFDNFLSERSFSNVSPLLSIIGLGKETVESLYRRSRNNEAREVEKMIIIGFNLLNKLLMKRKADQNNVSKLENALFEKTIGKDHRQLTTIIANYIHYPFNPVFFFFFSFSFFSYLIFPISKQKKRN